MFRKAILIRLMAINWNDFPHLGNRTVKYDHDTIISFLSSFRDPMMRVKCLNQREKQKTPRVNWHERGDEKHITDKEIFPNKLA